MRPGCRGSLRTAPRPPVRSSSSSSAPAASETVQGIDLLPGVVPPATVAAYENVPSPGGDVTVRSVVEEWLRGRAADRRQVAADGDAGARRVRARRDRDGQPARAICGDRGWACAPGSRRRCRPVAGVRRRGRVARRRRRDGEVAAVDVGVRCSPLRRAGRPLCSTSDRSRRPLRAVRGRAVADEVRPRLLQTDMPFAVSAVVELTRATLPAVALIAIAPVACAAGSGDSVAGAGALLHEVVAARGQPSP